MSCAAQSPTAVSSGASQDRDLAPVVVHQAPHVLCQIAARVLHHLQNAQAEFLRRDAVHLPHLRSGHCWHYTSRICSERHRNPLMYLTLRVPCRDRLQLRSTHYVITGGVLRVASSRPWQAAPNSATLGLRITCTGTCAKTSDMRPFRRKAFRNRSPSRAGRMRGGMPPPT